MPPASAERAERHDTVHRRRCHHAVRHDRHHQRTSLIRYPKVNIVVHGVDRAVDIVGEDFDIAIRAHSGPLPDSNLVQRTLAPAPWFLFAGSGYLAANGEPQKPPGPAGSSLALHDEERRRPHLAIASRRQA